MNTARMYMEIGQCLYASKPCNTPRSLKDNGQLHRLCTFHRIRANDAQRRWHLRQREIESGAQADPVTTATAADKSTTKKRRRATRSDTSDDSSESDVTQVPRCRRRRKLAPLARPMALMPSRPVNLTELVVTTALPQVDVMASFYGESNALSDEELAQLSEFILELEEESFSQDGFEREWWLAGARSPKTSVYYV